MLIVSVEVKPPSLSLLNVDGNHQSDRDDADGDDDEEGKCRGYPGLHTHPPRLHGHGHGHDHHYRRRRSHGSAASAEHGLHDHHVMERRHPRFFFFANLIQIQIRMSFDDQPSLAATALKKNPGDNSHYHHPFASASDAGFHDGGDSRRSVVFSNHRDVIVPLAAAVVSMAVDPFAARSYHHLFPVPQLLLLFVLLHLRLQFGDDDYSSSSFSVRDSSWSIPHPPIDLLNQTTHLKTEVDSANAPPSIEAEITS